MARHLIHSFREHDRHGLSVYRHREDAALLQLERAVYNAAEAQGMRGTIAAHKAMQQARGWTKRHPITRHNPIRVGSYVITAERVAEE